MIKVISARNDTQGLPDDEDLVLLGCWLKHGDIHTWKASCDVNVPIVAGIVARARKMQDT